MLHHANTNSFDYTMKNGDTNYICFEIFSTDGVIQTIVVFSLNTGFFYAIFNRYIQLEVISITVAGMLSANVLIWNTIHAYVHGFDPSIICSPKGVPRKYITDNGITGWLINNHRIHHDVKNTIYNIVFPGADYLLGTYYSRSSSS